MENYLTEDKALDRQEILKAFEEVGEENRRFAEEMDQLFRAKAEITEKELRAQADILSVLLTNIACC
jgi:hypothetical protein